MLTQDVIETLHGYSLKRDYLGDSLNYRNIETFSLELEMIDMANHTTIDVAAAIGPNVKRNQLSTYVKAQVAARLAVDKHNITIKSIEIPNSEDGKEDLVRMAKYLITVEVRTAVDSATLDIQHPELNPATDAENKKFHGVKTALTAYAVELDSVTESFDFADDADGKKNFTHTVDVTLKSGANTPKDAAVNIAVHLFASDVDNEYFGHNTFINALKDYGSGANNKHYYTESYDLKQNKFSFSKKIMILPASYASYTTDVKYSVEFNKEGRVSVSETLDIRSRDGTWANLLAGIPALKAASGANCLGILGSYTAELNSAGVTSPGLGDTLFSQPVQRSVVYDEQSLTATISTTFSNDPQVVGATIQETIDVDKDTRGVVKINYNVDFSLFDQKTFNNDQAIVNAATGKTIIEVIKDYDNNALTRIQDIYNHTGGAGVGFAVGMWGSTLSFLLPAGRWGQYASGQGGNCCFMYLTTAVTSSNMGKAYSLKKTFSNEFSTYNNWYMGGNIANLFNKIEVKWNDSWPKQIVNEHPIINRGTSPITRNLPGTSAVAPAFQTTPGKRSVTLNGVHARPAFNMLTNVTVPWAELKLLAYEAKAVLQGALLHPKTNNSLQSVGYLSNLSYTFDSRRNISLTAELTYTYKGPPI